MNRSGLLSVALAVLTSGALGQTILPDTAYCQKFSDQNPTEYCLDSTPCKSINGIQVCLAGTTSPPAGATILKATCWSVGVDYTCLQYKDTCATYTSDSNCREVGERTCTKSDDGSDMTAVNPKTGECSSYSRTFMCKEPKASDTTTVRTTSCDVSGLQDGLSWSATSESAADDFVRAATGQEFARQVVTYGTADNQGINGLFPGKPYKCTDGYAGLKSCCKSSGGGGITNQSWAQSVGSSVAMAGFKQGAGYAAAKGSALVYDSVMASAPEYMTAGVKSFLDAGISNSWQASGFGAYGLGTSASAAGGMFGASSSMALGTVGNTTIYFNPYALAAAIAIQLVMEAIACNEKEIELGNLRGQKLCIYVGSYCSKKSLFGCMEKTQSYCCFNGLLAKGIQSAAHAQLGLQWGKPKAPDCKGLTPQQLMSLDFSAPSMEAALEPFKNQIMSNFNKNAAPAIANGSVQSGIAAQTSSTAGALCLQRQKLDPSTVCQ